MRESICLYCKDATGSGTINDHTTGTEKLEKMVIKDSPFGPKFIICACEITKENCPRQLKITIHNTSNNAINHLDELYLRETHSDNTTHFVSPLVFRKDVKARKKVQKTIPINDGTIAIEACESAMGTHETSTPEGGTWIVLWRDERAMRCRSRRNDPRNYRL